MQAVDYSIGKMRAKVKDDGIEDNTIIIFTTDNGGIPNITKNAPFKGGKGSLFESGVRVPFCVSWPKEIKVGSKSSIPISGADFMPTFDELSGAPLPKTQPVDGKSIVPTFRGETVRHGPIFWHYPLYLVAYGKKGSSPASLRYQRHVLPRDPCQCDTPRRLENHSLF